MFTVHTAGSSSVARGAIGGDLDQVLLVTDDLVGAIPGAVRFFKKPHPFRKGSTLCEMGAQRSLSHSFNQHSLAYNATCEDWAGSLKANITLQ